MSKRKIPCYARNSRCGKFRGECSTNVPSDKDRFPGRDELVTYDISAIIQQMADDEIEVPSPMCAPSFSLVPHVSMCIEYWILPPKKSEYENILYSAFCEINKHLVSSGYCAVFSRVFPSPKKMVENNFMYSTIRIGFRDEHGTKTCFGLDADRVESRGLTLTGNINMSEIDQSDLQQCIKLIYHMVMHMACGFGHEQNLAYYAFAVKEEEARKYYEYPENMEHDDIFISSGRFDEIIANNKIDFLTTYFDTSSVLGTLYPRHICDEEETNRRLTILRNLIPKINKDKYAIPRRYIVGNTTIEGYFLPR